VPIFQRFEPRTLVQHVYVNHAHNDWLELWLGGGVPAILLIIGFLSWFAAASHRVWRASRPEASVLDLALAQAATIVIILLLLHSLVDYPLQIPTLSVLFAIACACLIPPRRSRDDEEMSARLTEFAPASTVGNRY
jgi:O-antigen ligase